MAIVGSTLTYTVTYSQNPTTVRFTLLEAIDGTELDWTYNAAPVSGTHYPVGANPVVLVGTTYTVEWVARKPERHVGVWKTTGVIDAEAEQQTQFVRHTDVPSAEVY